jgi:flagellar hook-associated protein 3 FlgL
MRVTSSMYYDSLYGNNNLKLNKELFDVNKQIASGLKIQYASDDVTTFTETMRLDNEITTLGQIKKSTESGYKVSDQSDVVLNEFTGSMNRMRTLLLQAANGTNDSTSLDAIAKELRGIEEGFKNLANTSINGQYLFSGSAVDVRPISDDGTYNGNDVAMNAFLGSRNQQQYNITGAELFLGEEKLVNREVTSNVLNSNLLGGDVLTSDSPLRDLMGDKNGAVNTDYFYIRGIRTDGTAFNQALSFNDTTDTVQDLLDSIENLYGSNLVNVSLNGSGQIVVEDKQKGSSKLDFHMVGAVDYSGGGAADIGVGGDIASLDTAGANIYPPAGDLYVKEFIKSGFTSSAVTNIEGLAYDRTEFSKTTSTLTSNVSQVLKKSHIVTDGIVTFDAITPDRENSFAKSSTLLSEVFDLSQGTADTLNGTQLKLVGKDLNNADYDITINLNSAGSTFTRTLPLPAGTSFDIYNMDTTRAPVDADKMTYQQLMDVVNMAITGSIPAATFADANAYDAAIKSSDLLGATTLTFDGKIEFSSKTPGITAATISIYDANSGSFTSGEASVATFNTNNALTIRDPKTDFFKTINEIVTAVEEHKLNPDSSSGNMRNVGIENAIAMIDDLQDHVFRTQSVAGAHSNTLNNALNRTELLEVSTMSLRSSVIDTDLAESSLRLTQLTLNYEAMLSTVGRVSKLSLVNYL